MTTQASALTIAGRPQKRFSFGRILAWAALVLMILAVLIPFWWMVRTAFRS